MKIEIIRPQSPFFYDVIILGKQHSKTLGMFPEGAFRDHARKNTLFAAVDDGVVAGYVLFRITRSKNIICITHLCVRSEYRKKGIAYLLLDTVKGKYSRLFKGISLSCRQDYVEPCHLWERYGFRPVKTIRSRSIEEKYLIKWWYDFGNIDLFSQHPDSATKVQALLDSNIIMKLSDANREESAETFSLLADWLIDEVDYFYAPEVFNEIHRDSDRARAEKTRQYIYNFTEARFTPDERDKIFFELETIVSGTSDNDRSDRKQLADCIAAGIDYFITLDDGLLRVSEHLHERYYLKVLRPADFILSIDHQLNGEDYRAYRLAGARHEYAAIQPAELAALVEPKWLHMEQGEKKHLLLQKLTTVITDLRNSVFRLIKDVASNCIGYFALQLNDNHQVNIKAVRTVKGKIAGPLFQQLIREIIDIAIEKDCNLVINEETLASDNEIAILISFGFSFNGTYWYKIIVVGQVTSLHTLQTNDRINQYWDITSFLDKIGSLTLPEQSTFALALEKKLWPARFTDIDVPNYIIPIKPYWAGQLFDHRIANTTLFGASPHLSWSKENVYYRSVNPVSEVAPGRILWYVSYDERDLSGRSKAIVATSYLEEVHIGPAKQLYHKFKNYGIYEWRHIYQLAGKVPTKEIKALKFADTELFKKTLSLQHISATLRQFGRPTNTFASPLQISSQLFNELYRLAKQ